MRDIFLLPYLLYKGRGFYAEKKKHRILSMVLIVAMTAGMVDGLGGCGKKNGDELTITNVSYDPTREFYEKYNVLFEQYYEKISGKKCG